MKVKGVIAGNAVAQGGIVFILSSLLEQEGHQVAEDLREVVELCGDDVKAVDLQVGIS